MKLTLRLIIFVLTYTFIATFLTSCETDDTTVPNQASKTTTTVKTNAPLTMAQTLDAQLQNRKIDITTEALYTSIDLPSFYVFTTKDKIRNHFKIYLDIIAHNLKKYTFKKIIVAGYTDNANNLLANEKLSKTWATEIANYLISKNISRNKVVIEANGMYAPIASNYTLAGRMRNRRVEIHIYQ